MPIGISEVVIFSAGGIVGYLGRQLLEHKLAIIRNFQTIKTTEFNKAAATFRAAFVDAIYTLRRSAKYGNKTPGNILIESVFAEHEKAKIMFEPFLYGADLQGFNSAWDNYRNYQNNYCMGNGPKGPIDADAITTTEGMSQYCLDHINHLLSFAEPKIST